MKLSIVLPTRNRANYLLKTLSCYEKIATDIPWELVVVDNGSTDATAQVLVEFVAKGAIPVRALLEPRVGAACARNTGWRHARGEIIAFLDDDCYPQLDFVNEVWNNFSESDIGYIGGRILLYDPSDYPITIQLRDNRLIIAPGSFIPAGLFHSANLAARREVLEASGGFDEMLGAGTPFFCEDVDFISRASAAGFMGAYDPRPVVFHHHRRRTKEQADTLKRLYDIGRGAYYMKCVLDPARRQQAVKNWYWSMRGNFAYSVRSPCAALINFYELQGALGYLLKRIIGQFRNIIHEG